MVARFRARCYAQGSQRGVRLPAGSIVQAAWTINLPIALPAPPDRQVSQMSAIWART